MLVWMWKNILLVICCLSFQQKVALSGNSLVSGFLISLIQNIFKTIINQSDYSCKKIVKIHFNFINEDVQIKLLLGENLCIINNNQNCIKYFSPTTKKGLFNKPFLFIVLNVVIMGKHF